MEQSTTTNLAKEGKQKVYAVKEKKAGKPAKEQKPLEENKESSAK